MIMATCKDCLHYDVCKSYGVIMHNSVKLKMTEEVESKCPYKLFKSKIIKTNADRIRAMSDEELAKWLNQCGCVCETCSDSANCVDPYNRQKCINGVLNWLKQPAEE